MFELSIMQYAGSGVEMLLCVFEIFMDSVSVYACSVNVLH